MNGLNYLIQTNLYLLLFMGFYVLILRNETFFRQNRFFLNTSIFLSFLIPFINSDWFRDLFITQRVREAAIMPTQMMYETIIVGANESASTLSVSDALFWVYASGATFLLSRFILRLIFLRSRLTVTKGSAFSFFNTLVVDKEIPKAETIIGHEKVHMRQWHSADIIFIELAAIVNWFNPVMYLYKKEIRHIHEFIADEEAARLMQSKSDYAMLLFSNTLGVDPLHLSNNFFNKSLLKRRILMLHKNRSRSTGLWKYGFSAPLFILMLIVSAAAVRSEETIIRPVAETLLSTLPEKTSNEIMSALDFDQVESKFELLGREELVVAGSDNKGQSVPDFEVFKKHIMKNIKYPASARKDEITGFVLANFIIKEKKVMNVQIGKSVRNDLDQEVIRALSLFTSDMNVPNDNYSVAISFNLIGAEGQTNIVEEVSGENFIGQITVTAMRPDNLNVEDFKADASPKKSLQLQEVLISNDNTIKEFSSVDVLPEFPGGLETWSNYLQGNLKYPKLAKDNKVTGRVIVSFIVEKDGSLSEIKVLRGLGAGLDEEAVRVLKASPKWRPGIQDGKAVRVAYTMPIFFQLANNPPSPGNTDADKTAQRTLPADVKDFASVKTLPEFSGGMAGWGKYLSENLKYPEQAKKDSISGRVIVGFIVEKDGTLSDIKVLRGIGGGLDEEAVRVLKNSPKWQPGRILDGSLVRVAYTMPIFFNLGNK